MTSRSSKSACSNRVLLWSFGFWIGNLVTVLTVLTLAGVL